MKMLKFKRFITTAVILLVAYLLQSTVFPHLELAGIKPNLLLIVTAAFGLYERAEGGNVDRTGSGAVTGCSVWRYHWILRLDLSAGGSIEWSV